MWINFCVNGIRLWWWMGREVRIKCWKEFQIHGACKRQEIKRNVAFPCFMEKLKCFVCKYRFLFSFLSPSQPKPVIKYFRVDGNFILEENSRKLKISSLLFRLNSWALFLNNFAFAHTSRRWSEIKSFWSFSADFYDLGYICK